MFLPRRYGPQGKVDNIPRTRIKGKNAGTMVVQRVM